MDAVVHLAELSNDPLGQHNPELTYDINHAGAKALAKKCLKAGVRRFVYTSSCSVYGTGSGEFKEEHSKNMIRKRRMPGAKPLSSEKMQQPWPTKIVSLRPFCATRPPTYAL